MTKSVFFLIFSYVVKDSIHLPKLDTFGKPPRHIGGGLVRATDRCRHSEKKQCGVSAGLLESVGKTCCDFPTSKDGKIWER